jgi:PAS domain S-box-containing protein
MLSQQTRPDDTHRFSSESADNKSSVLPAIAVPRGGGAIRGIGEKFGVNPVTGTASLTIPLTVSPGRSGFGPQLSLSHDSGAGNGPFGFGWSLSLPTITRKTDKGLPQYFDAEESDVFLLSGAEDLVPEFDSDGNRFEDGYSVYIIHRYRPRIEGLFARIERWTNTASPDDVFWRSISKDNITTWYGRSRNSRIVDPANPTHVFGWLICESHDDKGNVIIYEYKPEDSARVFEDARGDPITLVNERNRERTANRYPKRIRYGNHTPCFPTLSMDEALPVPPGVTESSSREGWYFESDSSQGWYFEIVFDYGEHDQDKPIPSELDGKKWDRRNDPFSSYRAGFEVRTYRLCQRMLMFHHFPDEQEMGKNCLVRSTDFTYSYEQNPSDVRNPVYSFLLSVTQSGYKRQNGGYVKRSLPALEFVYSQPIVQYTVQDVETASLENLPVGLDGSSYQWIDLDGEGTPGIVTEQANAWFYKRNLSPINVQEQDGREITPVKFAPIELVITKPNEMISGGLAQFMDLAGDGQPDLVVLDGPMPGFYEHDERVGWNGFRPFTSRLNCDTRDPNLKFIDLNGDGHADILLTEDNAFTWYPSLAENGFGPAQHAPKACDEEKGPALVFADSTQSIYLADMSGDALTDLVRVRNGEVCYWPNLGYGRFGARVTMDSAPWFDYPDQFDQRRIRLRIVKFPIPRENQPPLVGAFSVDVTREKQTEDALRTSEELYRSLVGSLDAVITLFDASGQALYTNEIAARRLNLTPETMVGKYMTDLFPPPIAAYQLQAVQRVIQTGEGFVDEAISSVLGEVRWYRTSVQPVRDAAGAVTSALVNAVDITHLKQTEEALRRCLNGAVETCEADPFPRADGTLDWVWTAQDAQSKAWLAWHVGGRAQADAHRLVHRVKAVLASGCVPVFTSDGLRQYFYALTAHFGQWVEEEGKRKSVWQVLPALLYGQFRKVKVGRKLKRVYPKMLCGERSVLCTVLQSIGLSGVIQTAYVERLNLTIRHTVAALRRRTWALAHSVRTLRWRVALGAAYYNFCRTHHALRMEVGQGRYRQRTPAMALGVTGHVWSVKEFITHPVY